MAARKPASEVARWQGSGSLWIDHAEVREQDLEWMAPARWIVLWNVRVPDGALARLPGLAGISVRGGSGQDLSVLCGCESLLCVDVNQVRGLEDLSELSRLRSIEFLSLYGLPRVKALPSLAAHERLRHVELGSMKGLETLEGVVAAPKLSTVTLIRAVNVSERDVELLAGHPTLEAFEWYGEDVSDRVVEPVRARFAHLARPRALRPEDWLRERLAKGAPAREG
jgi:hypothetical protein